MSRTAAIDAVEDHQTSAPANKRFDAVCGLLAMIASGSAKSQDFRALPSVFTQDILSAPLSVFQSQSDHPSPLVGGQHIYGAA